MFVVVHRQFASAIGTKELKVSVRLPSGSETAADGTVVFPAKVWTTGAKAGLLELPGYFAATDGTIWSKITGEKLKKLKPNKNIKVNLQVKGKSRNLFVHRIVASTFLSTIRHAGQVEVDHISPNNKSPALANLRWATRSQNESNKCLERKKAANKKVGVHNSRAVQQLSIQDGRVIAEFESGTAAAAAVGLRSHRNICSVIAGRRLTAGGFKWRFAPPDTTLEAYKARGYEVIGGLEEAPHLYFSAELFVYNDRLGKMYKTVVAHGETYPYIRIGSSLRGVHQVVAALRGGYKSMRAFDEYCAARLRDDGERVVVMHAGDLDKEDWWNCSIGTQKENMAEAAQAWACAVVIRLSPDPTAEIWKYDGTREAVFSSSAEAGRALAKYSLRKNLASGIAQSARTGWAFSLLGGGRAWAFAATPPAGSEAA